MDFRQALPEGTVVGGDYRILGVLGQGGFGLTYKAEDVRLGTPVAIKEYFPSDIALRDAGYTVHSRSSQDQGVFGWGREKFLEEARTLARFRNPNIVRVARLFEANNTAYMVLDFESGPNLSQWRRTLGRSPTQDEVDHITKALLDAVEAVHAGGVLHRDIKPANVIMRDGTTPILIDFGAARQALGGRSKTVHAIVTPGYSPKEQYALDVDRQGAWSDIYALGATLYFLVTGEQPADALSRDLEASSPMRGDGTEPYRATFMDAVDAAMQTRSQDRPQTIAEWRPMLLSGTPTPRAVAAIETVETKLAVAPKRASAGFGGTATPSPRSASSPDISAPAPAPAPPEPRFSHAAIAGIFAVAALAGGLGYYRFVAKPPVASTVASNSVPPVGGIGAPAPPSVPPVVQPSATPPGNSPNGTPTQTVVEAARPVASPSTPPSSSSPTSPPGTFSSRLPVRLSLPGAILPADLDRLKQEASAQDFKLARSAFPQDGFRGFSEQVREFAVELDRLSGGKLKINVLAPEDAPRTSEILHDASKKSEMLGWHAPFQSNNRGFVYSIFSGGVPFGLGMADHIRWMRAEGANLLEQAYWRDGFAVRAIPCGVASGLGGWFRRELKAPADLRGMKFRSMNVLLDQIFRKVGAETIKLDIAAAPAAIADQTLDAFYTLTPTARGYLGTSPAAPVFLTSDWFQPAYLFDLVIGTDAWLAMSGADRRLLDEACKRNLDRWLTDFPTAEAETLNRIRNHKAVVTKPLAPSVLEAFRTATREALQEEAARDQQFRDVLASYNRFAAPR